MKIAVLLSRFPYPLEKGDKLRAYQHLQHLKQLGHEVHLIALTDVKVLPGHYDKIKPLCESIHIIRLTLLRRLINLLMSFVRRLPLQVGYFYSASHSKEIQKIITVLHPDLLYFQLIRTALFRKSIPDIPAVIDYMDAFATGTSQRTKNASVFLKFLYRRELRLVKRFEYGSYDWFNKHLIISIPDQKAMNVPDPSGLEVLPNGVDTGFFIARSQPVRTDVLFVGNMNYPPNVDAAQFLIHEIMPLVWKSRPQTTVSLAGANPHPSVKMLASEKVNVTGWMDDIRDAYGSSRIFIAPMRIGTGLQNKLLEAMAMNLPGITTSLSFEPLQARAGTDILVGNSKEELAGHILELLNNETLAATIAANGKAFILKTYSLHHSQQLLGEIIGSARAKK